MTLRPRRMSPISDDMLSGPFMKRMSFFARHGVPPKELTDRTAVPAHLEDLAAKSASGCSASDVEAIVVFHCLVCEEHLARATSLKGVCTRRRQSRGWVFERVVQEREGARDTWGGLSGVHQKCSGRWTCSAESAEHSIEARRTRRVALLLLCPV